MASMNFSSGKQFVKPPQRGIFPLDHDAECKPKMQASSCATVVVGLECREADVILVGERNGHD